MLNLFSKLRRKTESFVVLDPSAVAAVVIPVAEPVAEPVTVLESLDPAADPVVDPVTDPVALPTTECRQHPRDIVFEEKSRAAIVAGECQPLREIIESKRAIIEATHSAQQRNAERLVRERAYFLWEDAGCPDDRDIEFWLQAEREFHQQVNRWLVGVKV